jgi:hypothetical protein
VFSAPVHLHSREHGLAVGEVEADAVHRLGYQEQRLIDAAARNAQGGVGNRCQRGRLVDVSDFAIPNLLERSDVRADGRKVRFQTVVQVCRTVGFSSRISRSSERFAFEPVVWGSVSRPISTTMSLRRALSINSRRQVDEDRCAETDFFSVGKPRWWKVKSA